MNNNIVYCPNGGNIPYKNEQQQQQKKKKELFNNWKLFPGHINICIILENMTSWPYSVEIIRKTETKKQVLGWNLWKWKSPIF